MLGGTPIIFTSAILSLELHFKGKPDGLREHMFKLSGTQMDRSSMPSLGNHYALNIKVLIFESLVEQRL